jgi:hypothetical protein
MDMTNTTAPEAPVETPVEESDTLTAVDRCDRCGAQAYVSVLLEAGELLFCSHDYNEMEEKITPSAKLVVDERYKLHKTAKLDVSAD